jgi:lipopolysaccharide transport system permease protein
LLLFLAWRDLKASYAQTLMGASWILVKPLLLMAIFTVVFGWFVRVPSDGLPYSLFFFAGLVPWQLFVRSFSAAGTSLAANQNLISTAYFPRLLLPLSALLCPALESIVMTVMLVVMMICFGIKPAGTVWVVPMLMATAAAAGFAAGVWLAALSVSHRDFAHAHPFVTQMWFFLTPVAYPEQLVPQDWLWVYRLNPLTGVVEASRSALLGIGHMNGALVMSSLLMIALFLASGVYYFCQVERDYVDTV